jgi:hypothetical protein
VRNDVHAIASELAPVRVGVDNQVRVPQRKAEAPQLEIAPPRFAATTMQCGDEGYTFALKQTRDCVEHTRREQRRVDLGMDEIGPESSNRAHHTIRFEAERAIPVPESLRLIAPRVGAASQQRREDIDDRAGRGQACGKTFAVRRNAALLMKR